MPGNRTLTEMPGDTTMKLLCLAHVQLIKEYLMNDNIMPIWINPVDQWDLLEDLLDILERDLEESVVLKKAKHRAALPPFSSPTEASTPVASPGGSGSEARPSADLDYSSLDDILSIIESDMPAPERPKNIKSPDTCNAHHGVNTPTSTHPGDDQTDLKTVEVKTSVARPAEGASRLCSPAPGSLKFNPTASRVQPATPQLPAPKRCKSRVEYTQRELQEILRQKFEQRRYLNHTMAYNTTMQLAPPASQVTNWLQEKSLSDQRERERWASMHASRNVVTDGRWQHPAVGGSPSFPWICEPYFVGEPSAQILMQAPHSTRIGNSSNDTDLMRVRAAYSSPYPLSRHYNV